MSVDASPHLDFRGRVIRWRAAHLDYGDGRLLQFWLHEAMAERWCMTQPRCPHRS